MTRFICLLVPLLAIFLAVSAFAQACTTNAECLPRGPGFECNPSSQCEWVPPIGIPKPDFGIEESYRMYDVNANRNPDLNYTQNPEGGYYTHYVDNTHPNATDSGNTYGSVLLPRQTIPRGVPEGSIVEIHGGPYQHTSGPNLRLDGFGTALRPVFFRALSSSNLVRIGVSAQTGFQRDASYVIIENLSLYSYRINPDTDTTVGHIALRNSEVTGSMSGGGMGIVSWVHDNWIDSVIIYNVHIHGNGPWDATEGDPDVHGVGIGSYVKNLWIIDNTIYHNGGNGIQLTGAGPSGNNLLAHHIYMGRNTNSNLPNLQSFIGIKGSSDIIVSENHVSGQGGYRTGYGMGFQYGPERVWFLFNRIHNISGGIVTGSNSVSSPGQESYFIGNLIYNIWQKDYSTWNPNNPWANAALSLWGGVNRYVIGNTIYNVDAGIYTPSSGAFYIMNNIISEVTQPEARHIFMETRTRSPNSLFYNNFFSQEIEEGDVRIQWGDLTGNLETFESLTEAAQNNIEADPLFVNASNSDFSLQSGSSAIDAGIESGVYDTFYDLYGIDIRKDLEGKVRPPGSAWDIGAFEFEGATCVDTDALLNYISQWEAGSLTMPYLIGRIAAWKSGEGCP